MIIDEKIREIIIKKLEEELPKAIQIAIVKGYIEILRRDVKKHSFIKTQKQCLEDFSFEIKRELESLLNDLIFYQFTRSDFHELFCQTVKKQLSELLGE